MKNNIIKLLTTITCLLTITVTVFSNEKDSDKGPRIYNITKNE